MNVPITEFYKDEGLINGQTMLVADEGRQKIHKTEDAGRYKKTAGTSPISYECQDANAGQ